MDTRLMRVLVVFIGMAIGITAGYFLKDIDTRVHTQRTETDALREQAKALSATIAEVRVGLVSYVARGQGEAFWMAHVAGLLPTLQQQSADFGATLTAPGARAAHEAAVAALENFRTIDSRVKEFVTSGNSLLAADLIFSDGLESAATASTQVAAALSEELQARAAGAGSLRARAFAILGGAGGGILLLMLALALTGAASQPVAEPQATIPTIQPIRFEAPLPRAKLAIIPKLVNTARICGEFAKVGASTQLPDLLARAAKVLDASGVIVWVGDPTGDLHPAMSFGYSDHAVAKMGAIPRGTNNAAAAAYRAGEMRTVPSEAAASGALVAPLLTSDGCVGVLSAEIKGGSEKDEGCQALAMIFAAQLATLVAPPAVAAVPKAAAQG